MYRNPAMLHTLLARLTDSLVTYVCYQIQSGAQVVQLFDSWARHLTPGQFREFSMPYAEEVIRRVKEQHPDVPLIFHANGGERCTLPAACCPSTLICLLLSGPAGPCWSLAAAAPEPASRLQGSAAVSRWWQRLATQLSLCSKGVHPHGLPKLLPALPGPQI